MNSQFQLKQYEDSDYFRVADFLRANYPIQAQIPFNWSITRWHYMHHHPLMQENNLVDKLNKIGVFEKNGDIVAVVHFEHDLETIYFEFALNCSQPKSEESLLLRKIALDYAEENLYKQLGDGRKYLKIYVNDANEDMVSIANSYGYKGDSRDNENNSSMLLEQADLQYVLPQGFKIQSLSDDNDLVKLDRLLHRGFNHEGEPPSDSVIGRKRMQEAPNYNKNLNIVAVDEKSGNFVSLCGGWYDEVNKSFDIEPVATDPDFRMLGLGRACVLESIKRGKDMGATIALVGSDQPFYRAIGFKDFSTNLCFFRYY